MSSAGRSSVLYSPGMRRYRLTLVLLLLALLPVLSTLAQTGTPPADTATPAPTLTPAPTATLTPEETCVVHGVNSPECWEPIWRKYRLPGLVILALAALGVFAFLWFLAKAGTRIGDNLFDNLLGYLTYGPKLRQYLETFLNENRYFGFRGIDMLSLRPIELDKGYVPLGLLYQDETEQKGKLRDAQRLGDPSEAKAIETHKVIQKAPKLSIIGDAGSGKSALLQWIGLSIARYRLNGRRDLSGPQRELIRALRGRRIPVIILLRDYDRYCREDKKDCERTPQTLREYLQEYFVRQRYASLNLPANFFTRLLERDGLIMFDGMDEVDVRHRPGVRAAIEGVMGSGRSQFIVTTRPSAANTTAALPGFQSAHIGPVTPEQRGALIDLWCKAVYTTIDEANGKKRELLQQIADPRVKEMGYTPLMLNIFMLVFYYKKKLPSQRAEMFEYALQVLLQDLHKDAPQALREWGGLKWQQWRDTLALAAFIMHDEGASNVQASDLIAQPEFWQRFGNDFESAEEKAKEFLRLAASRGGLLREDGNRYDFYVRRFREFLAGRYLVTKLEERWEHYLQKHLPDDGWEESLVLAAGFLAFDNLEKSEKFLRRLVAVGGLPELEAYAKAIGGIALEDLLKTADEQVRNVFASFQGQAPADMLKAMTQTDEAGRPLLRTPLRRRLGLALAELGDPRLARPLWKRSAAEVLGGYFLPIPAGKFRMGTSNDEAERLKAQEAESWDDEKPQHEVEVSAFAIGQYPVTNAEYRLFIADPDYGNPDYWPGEAGLWLNGQTDLEKYVAMLSDKELQESYRSWLKNRPPPKRRQPYYWDSPQWNAANQPVVGVTWYEAQAYCLWLTARLRAAKLIAADQRIYLPTEAQWEKAARVHPGQTGSLSYVDGRLWPWGDEWDADKCNSTESKFGGATPVGMYPNGASGYGLQDMVGNVWEWTSTVWGKSSEAPDFAYPYRSDDGREDPNAVALRAVRFGSWSLNRRDCRAAVRNWVVPAGFDFNAGFRAALVPLRS